MRRTKSRSQAHYAGRVTVDGAALLASVRVLDLADGAADMVGRLFADLGADVLKVEPPGGSPSRDRLPTLSGISVPFALHNANKRSTELDPAEAGARDRFLELASLADIVIDSGRAAAFGLDCVELADRHQHLVVLSVTDFGATGPRSSWQATDPVLYALAGSLSRSGPTTGTPVLPPDGIASATAAAQGAWAALVAYYHRLRCGIGDYIDFSRLDAVVMALDPAFGAHGQAAAGIRSPSRWRGRPRNQDAYPIYACKDGFVRLCVMSPRQWHGLRGWLGEPEQFQDPRYDVIAARFAAWPQISELIRPLFAGQTRAELVSAGQARGVPIAAVLSPSEILRSDHFQATGAITTTELAAGVTAAVPVGYFSVDGRHAGFRTPAPGNADRERGWRRRPDGAPTPDVTPRSRPFLGLRIVDLGIIVAGGELSRLFGDLGADVIKVESPAYPDGLRQARIGEAMSESFAWTHRNNLAFGLDLRSSAGKQLFGRLVADADAVFANFKPGTLAALEFSHKTLHELNPRLVVAESSAFGDHGPWSARMGYGPLVRASTGVTMLWTSEESRQDPAENSRHSFYDATTVFPDHVVARITAIGALAALIHRDRTGTGARVHVAQSEVVVNQLDTTYVAQAAQEALQEAFQEADAAVQHDTDVHAVCRCAGDDEWCVISIRSDSEMRSAASVLEAPELADDARFGTGEARARHRGQLTAHLSAWTRTRAPLQVAEAMQAAGVPAGPMNRPPDILDDPQLRSRNLYRDMAHPLIDHPLPAETGPAPFRHIPAAPQRPAPLPGQDTREICRKVLEMDAEDIERLIGDQVLFAPDTDV